MNQSSVQRNPYCYSWHEANICGLHFRNENKLIKVKSETSPLLKNHIHNQMCNLALIQNQHAPPNEESRPYSKSICTTWQDLNQGLSAWKMSVETTTPPGLDTILIEQQAIILPRMFKPSWLSTYKLRQVHFGVLWEANFQLIVPILNVLVGANLSLILISNELHTSFPSLS